MEGVTCPCCEDLFVDPMTLECGHIVCRLCLAGWCICEGKRECPVCHQVWYSNMLVAIADYKLRWASYIIMHSVHSIQWDSFHKLH